MPLQEITANVQGLRRDTMEDRNYIVANMVMLVEGVHSGSMGPMYYPSHELEKIPEAWNHKPVVINHPMDNDGSPISACYPEILSKYKVGVILNARFEDDKLKAEAWIDEKRLQQISPVIWQRLQQGQPIEVSTGLFHDTEHTAGTWNRDDYSAVATNYSPDHLAILPDAKGACSCQKGCGLLQNSSEELTMFDDEPLCLAPSSLPNTNKALDDPSMAYYSNANCRSEHPVLANEPLYLPSSSLPGNHSGQSVRDGDDEELYLPPSSCPASK